MISPSNAYIICSTQRSGSTYLCALLSSTGVAGHPREYFEAQPQTGVPPHPGFYLEGLPRTGVGVRDDPRPSEAPDYSALTSVESWPEHVERTFRLGTTPNGVFGAKLMWNQLPDIEQHAADVPGLAGLTGRALIEQLLGNPRYIWMRRRDKVRQAISLWRALQTRTWRREHPDSGDEPRLTYSFAAIDHLRHRLSADDEAWERFFESEELDVLELTYEDEVAQDPQGAVIKVAAHIGVRLPATWTPQARLLRQSDDVNTAWVEAYDRDVATRPSA